MIPGHILWIRYGNWLEAFNFILTFATVPAHVAELVDAPG